MGWLRENLHWVSLVGLVLCLLATAGTGALGLLFGLAALVSPGSAFFLAAAVEAALPYLVATVAFGLLSVLFLFTMVIGVLRKVRVPKSDRMVRVAEAVERRVPVLERFEVSEKVDPGLRERREKLKEQYVDGEISGPEFERELRAVMDEYDHEDPMLRSDPDVPTVDPHGELDYSTEVGESATGADAGDGDAGADAGDGDAESTKSDAEREEIRERE